MKAPTLKQLNEVRQEGFRPGVVACIINNNQILMFFKKEYGLWQFPQGRVNNKEEPIDALKKVLLEELGENFSKKLDFEKAEFIEQDRMEFKPGRHKIGTLADDEGHEVTMMGKEYYFYALNSSTQELEISQTQFDENFWMSFREAYFISDKIYQKGKRRITLKVVSTLQSLGMIT